MKIVLGIGNVGEKFEKSYHNVGFMVIDELAKRVNATISKKTENAFILEAKIGNEKVIIVKPTTYVNLSGEALVRVMKMFDVSIEDVIVAVDDIDMPVGKVRYRVSGTSGTHNGLRNIVLNAKSENFKRIKIGIGRNFQMRLDEFVLSKITETDFVEIEKAVDKAVRFLIGIFEGQNDENVNVTM
jgi:peptidyl-tRNA hydrolase, PTH1 family